jgi:hypothetical protein
MHDPELYNSELYLDMVRATIQRAGWAVHGLPDQQLAYTIGLTERGLPEVYMRGYDIAAAAGLLNQVAATIGQAPPDVAGDAALFVDVIAGAHIAVNTALGSILVQVTAGDAEGLAIANRLYPGQVAALQVHPPARVWQAPAPASL